MTSWRGSRICWVGIALFVLAGCAPSEPESIAGPDLNANGIRDDIDRLIEKRYSLGTRNRAAAEMLGRIYYLGMTRPEPVSRGEAVLMVQQNFRNRECFSKEFGPPSESPEFRKLDKEFEKLHVNTTERKRYISKRHQVMGGVAVIEFEFDRTKQCPNGLR